MNLKHSNIAAILIILGVVAAGGLVAWYAVNNSAGVPPVQPDNEISANTSGLPSHLTIPAIGVDAPIIRLGLAPDGSVDVPKTPYEVAWYQLGPRPGERGSAVITGHYGTWVSGAHSVFDNLSKLKAGDQVIVTDDQGKQKTFTVKELKTYKPTDSVPEVFTATDGSHLNLITCQGSWIPQEKTYTQRLVVFTDLAT